MTEAAPQKYEPYDKIGESKILSIGREVMSHNISLPIGKAILHVFEYLGESGIALFLQFDDPAAYRMLAEIFRREYIEHPVLPWTGRIPSTLDGYSRMFWCYPCYSYVPKLTRFGVCPLHTSDTPCGHLYTFARDLDGSHSSPICDICSSYKCERCANPLEIESYVGVSDVYEYRREIYRLCNACTPKCFDHSNDYRGSRCYQCYIDNVYQNGHITTKSELRQGVTLSTFACSEEHAVKLAIPEDRVILYDYRLKTMEEPSRLPDDYGIDEDVDRLKSLLYLRGHYEE